MAGRLNLLWSAASQTSRACSMMVCATFTSRKSRVAQRAIRASMPEMPMSAMSTLNWRMPSTAASPTMPRSRALYHAASDDDLALGLLLRDGGPHSGCW